MPPHPLGTEFDVGFAGQRADDAILDHPYAEAVMTPARALLPAFLQPGEFDLNWLFAGGRPVHRQTTFRAGQAAVAGGVCGKLMKDERENDRRRRVELDGVAGKGDPVGEVAELRELRRNDLADGGLAELRACEKPMHARERCEAGLYAGERFPGSPGRANGLRQDRLDDCKVVVDPVVQFAQEPLLEIGRASCRERVSDPV